MREVTVETLFVGIIVITALVANIVALLVRPHCRCDMRLLRLGFARADCPIHGMDANAE